MTKDIFRELITRLNPSDLATYLTSMGWTRTRFQVDHSSEWEKLFQGETVPLMLPLNRKYKDFLLRTEEALELIATVEQRSVDELLADLQTVGADVIRIRLRHTWATDGSIPLNQGELLIENTRELFLSGACSAIQTKPFFASRRPEEANRFVRNLRLGQTERGSYVVTVLSNVGMSLQNSLFNEETDPPFERKAVVHLCQSLAALRRAADLALISPTAKTFEDVVSEGVNGNLCSAIVKMSGENPLPSDELRVFFSFARSRPLLKPVPNEIVFEGQHIPVIREAAQFFRAVAPPEESEIRGAVIQLRRGTETGPLSGPILVMAFVDEKPRRVQIHLDEAGHQLAIRAYENGDEIACTGDLVKNGNSWALQNPKGFRIVPTE